MAGMFANGGGNPNMQYVPQDLQQGAPASPSFFGQGGAGRNIAGYLGDALIGIGGGKPVYAPMQAQRAEMEQRNALAQQQQAAEYQRQMAIAQYKHDNPDPGSIETNYNFLNGKDPKFGQSYLANAADPVVPFLNPMTGTYDQIHKSGAPVTNQASAIPNGTKRTINGKDAWYVNGDWYDNPEGR